MSAAQSTNPWGRYFERTLSAVTQPSLLRYSFGSEDYRRHVADFERTRIAPGADPRASWCSKDDSDHKRAVREADTPRWYETRDAEPRLAWLNERWNARGWRLRSSRAYRYVPADVIRWRDPGHRAELTRRASVHAALPRPGVSR